MKRILINPRDDWTKKVEEQGLIFHHTQGKPYWTESAFYEFSPSEIDEIEKATNDLHEMCLNAAQYVIDNNLFEKLKIPSFAIPLIKKTWEEEPPAIYGRFDFGYDGKNPPKMLEYNADTPTSLLEAAVVQWFWLQDVFPKRDQFNSIHEKLIAKWSELKSYLTGDTLYFAHLDDEFGEDTMTTAYLRDTAMQAGLITKALFMKDIGWNSGSRRFVDLDEKPITSIFKLYPWEWLVNEEFGANLIENYENSQWIEPPWKMILSNKGLLPILWELYPNHPNLLESYLGSPSGMEEYAKKPLLSREGANITLVTKDRTIETQGDYGEEGFIFQEYYPLRSFTGNYPVIGSWVIDGQSAGIGIRESDGPITNNMGRFVPHLF